MRLRHDEEIEWLSTPAEDLVGRARRHLQTLAALQLVSRSVQFQHCDTSENEKELPCALVKMPDLGCARRHPLTDDAQRGLVDEVPAVACVAPV